MIGPDDPRSLPHRVRRIRTSQSIRITQSSSWREQTLSVCDGQIDENRCQYRCNIQQQHGNKIHDKAGFKSRLKCHITQSENRRTDHVCFTHYRDYSRRERCAENCGTNDVSFRSAPSEVPDQDGRGAPKYVYPKKECPIAKCKCGHLHDRRPSFKSSLSAEYSVAKASRRHSASASAID
jgi:hypothetical protein